VPTALWVFVLIQVIGTAQTQQSTSDLVTAGCGAFATMDAENRSAAQSLVKLGAAALPEINTAFDSIEKSGNSSKFAPNAYWLLYAYAEIQGPAAFPRLRKMRGDPNFGFLYSAVDTAAALSLDITSYVSAWRQTVTDNACDGPSPRKALDRFILAWERNDHVKSKVNIAIGYAFDPLSPWSRRPEMQENYNYPRIEDLELDTTFKNGSGRDCGRERIKFLSPDFEIDSAGIADLRRVISRCAADN
jgi:hypothetical protein